MNESGFHDVVGRRAGLESPAAARRATEVTLRTLGERLSDGEVDDIAPRLPDGIADSMVEAAGGGTDDFPFDEFVERVADRLDTNEVDAERRARAVGATLKDAIGETEIDDARAQLPPAFDRLFWAVGYDEFLELVQREAPAESKAAASEAAVVTLEVLGERITAGEAAAVGGYLPPAFGEALSGAGTSATDLSADEFVERVAARADVERADAAASVRAVTAGLAEAIPDDEYRNLLDQLPDEYARLLGAVVDRDTDPR